MIEITIIGLLNILFAYRLYMIFSNRLDKYMEFMSKWMQAQEEINAEIIAWIKADNDLTKLERSATDNDHDNMLQ